MGQVLLIILGALLAFGGGLAAFFIQSNYQKKQQKKIIVEFFRVMLQSFIDFYPFLEDAYSRSEVIWVDHLMRIANELQIVERNWEHLILIEDSTTRKEIWNWFRRLKTNQLKITSLSQMKQQGGDLTWVNKEIEKEVNNLKTLMTEAKQLLEKLK